MNVIRYVGLDVHAESVSIAVADEGRAGAHWIGKFLNDESTLKKALRKLGKPGELRVVYEAGPTGYDLFRMLVAMGIECHVAAPTLIPVKSGDRIKTDRRDSEKLAVCLRSGDLTDVWVPTVETEGFRDLVRAREVAKTDELRARHRVGKFLLRNGLRNTARKAWTIKYMQWVRMQSFDQSAKQAAFDDYVSQVEQAGVRVAALEKKIVECLPSMPDRFRNLVEGLQSMKGVACLTAVTLVSEIESFSRFEKPTQLMSYVGVVPGEYSSGSRQQRGNITKAGNAHVRRVLVEAAWSARLKPAIGEKLRRRQSTDPRIRAISWKAQTRLHDRYVRLKARGKHHNKVLIAVAREMLGFLWEIGNRIEHAHMQAQQDTRVA